MRHQVEHDVTPTCGTNNTNNTNTKDSVPAPAVARSTIARCCWCCVKRLLPVCNRGAAMQRWSRSNSEGRKTRREPPQPTPLQRLSWLTGQFPHRPHQNAEIIVVGKTGTDHFVIIFKHVQRDVPVNGRTQFTKAVKKRKKNLVRTQATTDHFRMFEGDVFFRDLTGQKQIRTASAKDHYGALTSRMCTWFETWEERGVLCQHRVTSCHHGEGNEEEIGRTRNMRGGPGCGSCRCTTKLNQQQTAPNQQHPTNSTQPTSPNQFPTIFYGSRE